VLGGRRRIKINLYKTSNIFRPSVGISNIQNTFDKNREIKLGLCNYAIAMSTENSCIEINTKINSSQRYGTAQSYRNLSKVVQRCPNTALKFRTATTFKSSVTENDDSSKTCRYVRDLSLYTTSFV
jgi:hypothetical protein